MLGFWIIAIGTAAAAVAILGRALITGGKTDAGTAAYDVQVYRDQLNELERDVARGVISETEAARARVETSRRLLEADRRARSSEAPGRAPRNITVAALALTGIVIVVGGVGIYRVAGAPGTPDLPLATRIEVAETALASRPSQDAIEAELKPWSGPPPEAPADYLEMIDKLRATVADRPDDIEGQQLLAQHEGALGNFRAAHKAMARVIALKGEDANADDYTTYADLLVIAAEGQVSPEAEAALRKALELDPNNGIARYYLALMYAQNDRPDLAFPVWRDLLENATPGDPWVDPIRRQIRQLATMAGVDYTPPAAAGPFSGPSREDIEAAAEMSDEDRAAMIRGMIDRLMDRLATEGGTAQEWARLIGSLATIGDTDKARAVWGEAQAVFAEESEERALIDQTAAKAGLDAPSASRSGPQPGALPEASPQALPGPDADDIAAAAEMSDEDRAAMIDGMVTRLSDELATAGGPPDKWVMLLNSLRQLGETDRARIVWTEAQTYFADDADGLARVRAAAEAIGVAN